MQKKAHRTTVGVDSKEDKYYICCYNCFYCYYCRHCGRCRRCRHCRCRSGGDASNSCSLERRLRARSPKPTKYPSREGPIASRCTGGSTTAGRWLRDGSGRWIWALLPLSLHHLLLRSMGRHRMLAVSRHTSETCSIRSASGPRHLRSLASGAADHTGTGLTRLLRRCVWRSGRGCPRLPGCGARGQRTNDRILIP